MGLGAHLMYRRNNVLGSQTLASNISFLVQTIVGDMGWKLQFGEKKLKARSHTNMSTLGLTAY